MNEQPINQFSLWPEMASNFAWPVDLLYIFLIVVSVIFTVGIAAALLYFGIKYRRKSDDDVPAEVHGNNTLEIVWSVIPLLLTMIMFFWGAHLYFKMSQVPSDAMEILVTGKQWRWKLQHPNGKREINNLHLPLGQPIRCTMTSEDVIHSFFIPAFRVKQDVLPGRYTQLWFTPTKEGVYHLFCAEYCGTEHSRMGGSVTVMSPSEYEIWLEGGTGASLSPVEAGAQLFTSLGCVTCHDGRANAQGPQLAGVFGTLQPLTSGEKILADENYVRESILNPKAKVVEGFAAVMPIYKGMVTDSQITSLIAYLKSIGGEQDAGGGENQKQAPKDDSAKAEDLLQDESLRADTTQGIMQ